MARHPSSRLQNATGALRVSAGIDIMRIDVRTHAAIVTLRGRHESNGRARSGVQVEDDGRQIDKAPVVATLLEDLDLPLVFSYPYEWYAGI